MAWWAAPLRQTAAPGGNERLQSAQD